MDQVVLFLGAFAKLRKATTSFIMSVRLPVCMEQLGSPCTDFHNFFLKTCPEKIEVSLKTDKNNGNFT